MSTIRLLLPRLLRPLRPSPHLFQPTATVILPPRIRTYTTSKRYTFTDIQHLPSDKLLIDVREPSEYAAGAIPGAINLPITSAPEALCLPEDEFEDRFGFEKPKKDVEVVFYCKAGVRSAAAAKLAVQQGYEKVAEYPGSWVEWVKMTNESAS